MFHIFTNLSFFLKTKIFELGVLMTPSFQIENRPCSVELFSLASHRRIFPYILMVKSFFFFRQKTFKTTLLDDGTLRGEDIFLLKKHLPGIRIVLKKEADRAIKRKLKKYPKIFEYREKFWQLKRIIDVHFLAREERILLLDSDIFFFKKPELILDWISNQASDFVYFLKDFQNAYIFSDIETKHFFATSLCPKVNVGLLCYPRKLFSLAIINKFIEVFEKIKLLRSMEPFFMEQTLFALLFNLNKSNFKIKSLPSHYLIFSQRYFFKRQHLERLTCIHYTFFFEKQMYADGLRLLKRTNFFH